MQRNVVEGLLLAGKLCRKISEKWGRRQSQVFGVSQPCIGLLNMLQQRLPLLCFGIALVSGGLVLKESCRLSPCNVCLPQQFPEANCSNSGYRMVQGGSQFCRAAVRRDGSSRSHPPKRLVMLVEIAECRAGTTCCSSPLCLPHLLCESSSIVLSARIPVMPTTSGYANSLSRNGMTQSFQQLHCQPPIGISLFFRHAPPETRRSCLKNQVRHDGSGRRTSELGILHGRRDEEEKAWIAAVPSLLSVDNIATLV